MIRSRHKVLRNLELQKSLKSYSRFIIDMKISHGCPLFMSFVMTELDKTTDYLFIYLPQTRSPVHEDKEDHRISSHRLYSPCFGTRPVTTQLLLRK